MVSAYLLDLLGQDALVDELVQNLRFLWVVALLVFLQLVVPFVDQRNVSLLKLLLPELLLFLPVEFVLQLRLVDQVSTLVRIRFLLAEVVTPRS